jgi:S-adenosylmethionine decarboxylase
LYLRYLLCQNRRRGDGYIAYIDELYNANRLTEILSETCSIIGANILNIARQDYEPQGASVTILVSEEPVDPAYRQHRTSGPAAGSRRGPSG